MAETAEKAGPFRRRTVIALAVVCAVSLALSLVVGVLSEDIFERRSHRADAFSRSSIGHHALVRWLAEAGVDVLVSRHDAPSKASPTAPLLIAEPTLLEAGARSGPMVLSEGLAEMVREAEGRGAAVVLVLPKWRGRPSAAKRGWIDSMEPVGAEAAVAPLSEVMGRELPEELLERSDVPVSGCRGLDARRIDLANPQLLGPDRGLVPVVTCDGAMLVARIEGRNVFVIADPDLLNTQGLGKADNAAVVYALVVRQLGARALVVDEVLHGNARPPSLWRDVMTFPLLPVTLHVLALTALAVWAGMHRFGKASRLPPRLPPGKQAIVDSTAQLLTDGEAQADVLEPYYRMSIRHAAAACSVQATLDVDQQAARLAEIARARGVSVELASLREAMQAARGDRARELRVMSDIHRWRQEMMHGSR